jgi:hypothetical protein
MCNLYLSAREPSAFRAGLATAPDSRASRLAGKNERAPCPYLGEPPFVGLNHGPTRGLNRLCHSAFRSLSTQKRTSWIGLISTERIIIV